MSVSDEKVSELISSLEELVKVTRSRESAPTDTSRIDRVDDRIRRRRDELADAIDIQKKIDALEKELFLNEELSQQETRRFTTRVAQLEKQKELALELAVAQEKYNDAVERGDLTDQMKYGEEVLETEKNLNRLTDAQDAANKAAGRGVAKFELVSNKFLKVEGAARDFAEHIPMSVSELQNFGLEMMDAVKSGEFFLDVLKKLVAEGFNLSVELDKVNAELSRTTALFQETGTIMDQQARITRDVESSNRILGVTAAETGQALGALQSSMADFTRMGRRDRKEILNTATVMQELGISAQTSAQIFDKATKSLGYQNSEIRGIADELHATAQSLGVPFSQIAEDFNTVATELAFYGETAIDVFKDLAKQSKATGLSMQQLLKIGGQAFNTFDGAAQKVGRLNAILGGPYLNSIDMLNASEAERIDLIKQSMDASGQMFNDLSKYEQMAIADALGVSTEEARRLFGELDAAQEMDIRKKEKMEETARKAQATMDKLTNAFMSLVVELDPVVGLFSLIVEGISDFINTPIIRQVMQITLYVLSFVGALKFLGVAVAASLFPIVGAIAAVVTVAMILYKHFKNLREEGVSFGAIFTDIAQKVLLFTGPIGIAISLVISLFRHLKSGQGVLEALKNTVFDFLNNISFGLIGKLFGFGTNIDRGSFGFKKPKSVNDAIITTDGQIIEPSKQDTIIAAKPGGPIMDSLAEAATPLSDLAVSAMSPILNLLGGGTNNNITTNNNNNNTVVDQQPSNVNVIVKVGERELRDIFIDVLRDTTASSEISGFGGR